MKIEPFTTSFSNIGDQVFLRSDPKYRYFWDQEQGISVVQSTYANIQIKDILLPFTKTIIRKGDLDEEQPILELEDVEPRNSIVLRERMIVEVDSDKLDFDDCDFVFAQLRPYLGKIVINDPQKKYVGTTEWLPFKVDRKKVSLLLLKYMLLLPKFINSYNFLLSGKEHPRISKVDLRNMFMPLPSFETQVETEKKILPLQEKIISRHHSLLKSIEIVDDVFSREFGYSLEECDRRAEQNVYGKPFSSLDKSIMLRSSVKYQHPKYDYIDEILGRHTHVKLSALIASPINRGVQPEYSEDGDICVMKTGNLKNEFIDLSEAQRVNKEFYESKKDLAGVRKGDVLVASTGVGSIGKVDIYVSDEPAIADGHLSIIRFDSEKVNSLFMTYYLRSILGYLQIERDLSGSTNQIEIYPGQLEQMRVIDIPRTKQDLIASEICARLEELRKNSLEIKTLRDQIDTIIMQLMKT
jgi:type I restriction enzyme S subunit